MDPFLRTRNLFIQGAPVRVVLDALKQCPEWSTELFQDRVVNEVRLGYDSNVQLINHSLIVKNGREHDYEYSFIRKYFDMLMEKDVVCYSLYY